MNANVIVCSQCGRILDADNNRWTSTFLLDGGLSNLIELEPCGDCPVWGHAAYQQPKSNSELHYAIGM